MDSQRELYERYITSVKEKIMSTSETLTPSSAKALIEETVLATDDDLSLKEYKGLIGRIYAKVRSRLGLLEQYIINDNINEIMVNGSEKLFLEKNGDISTLEETFESVGELEEVIRNIAADVHREINEMNPILDARLKDGSRVNAVYKNVAINGPVLTIRKFSKNRITIEEMIHRDTLTRECAEFLAILVRCGYNIFVSGGTSSGKTTFLNALSDFIPRKERVIVIEDSAELQIRNIDNLIQMECHNANSIGQGRISMDMLIKTSLRMRPDRIIVGEVRGKEVADMLQAMNTGHDGSMSTGHGNSVAGMLRRLEAMYLMSAQLPMDAIRAQIVEGIDIMIHLGRLENGQRKVLEVQELIDFQDGKYVLRPLFQTEDGIQLVRTEGQLKNQSKIKLKGQKHD